MSSSHVQVAPDGAGKDVDTDALTSDETGSPTVYRQDIVVADPVVYANKAYVTRDNALKVAIGDELGSKMLEAQSELLISILEVLTSINENLESLAGYSGKHDLNKIKR